MCVYVSTIQCIEKYISLDQCLACNNVLYNNSVFLLSVRLTSHVVYAARCRGEKIVFFLLTITYSQFNSITQMNVTKHIDVEKLLIVKCLWW